MRWLACYKTQSNFAPDSFTTLARRAFSSRMKSPNCSARLRAHFRARGRREPCGGDAEDGADDFFHEFFLQWDANPRTPRFFCNPRCDAVDRQIPAAVQGWRMPSFFPPSGLPIEPPWALGPRSGRALLMVLLPALILLEWTVGSAFPLYLFYLVPVSLAAWSFGYRTGFGVAGVASGYCIFVSAAMRPPGAGLAPFAWQSFSTVMLFMAFAFVIAHHRRLVDIAVLAARVDFESGALSRAEFDRLLDHEVQRSRRHRRPMALAVVDAGAQEAGGKLASEIAETLRGCAGECDHLARLDKRCFAMLLVETEPLEADLLAVRVREALKRKFAARVVFGVSIISYEGANPATAVQLLNRAQAALSTEGGATAQRPARPQPA